MYRAVAIRKGQFVTETTTVEANVDAPAAKAPRRTGGALGGKVIAELQEIASGLGITGTEKMRKNQLIEAIKTARGETPPAEAPKAEAPKERATKADSATKDAKNDAPKADPSSENGAPQNDGGKAEDSTATDAKGEGAKGEGAKDEGKGDQRQGGQRQNQGNRNQGQANQGNRNQGQGNQGNRNQGQGNQNQNRGGQQGNQGGDDDDNNSRRRNRRGRNRGQNRGMDAEPIISEDDVLVPAAGILDVLDNYAFVRTTGYLPSENDVYVSLSMVRRLGLRRGDAIVGQVRQPREGERKEKFNPMVKIDSVNGMEIEEAKRRAEFAKLTPLYPSERLRLESQAGGLTGRVIDLVSPIGKGQRGLIVSPPKAGKTMIMQQVANAITENNPECHLMIVLVDERPEEVTDFQRTVKGEVIASTFDRPASDHTTVAELAIERAKRLVELGMDVVVLLDGITRLGRAYNLAAPASGRIMSGGVDSSALYPPKKFFGAARNIENGGSLTILATALIETGSRMDEVIFEEFKGTGNWELRLRREFADKRIFPAIDVDASSTRREELLLAKDELAVVWKLRRVLSGLEGQQGLELVLEKLKKTSSNIEFLMQINKTMPGSGSDD
ncbi:MAG: transcription termination factor Rho [Aeromicrobium sp.]|nr:MAG: transcription termination factor Rho [Aeromicrobium sp.]